MKLLWVDIETNGLNPKQDLILEVAAFVTDLQSPFTIESPIVQTVLPVDRVLVSSFSTFILEMHTKNGLLEECIARDREMMLQTIPYRYAKAMGKLEELLLQLIPDKDVVGRENITALAGSSVHFDRSFLETHMPTLIKQVSHRCYDVSAIKLFCRSLGMPKPPPEEAHRSLPDIQESLRHALICKQWLKSVGANL